MGSTATRRTNSGIEEASLEHHASPHQLEGDSTINCSTLRKIFVSLQLPVIAILGLMLGNHLRLVTSSNDKNAKEMVAFYVMTLTLISLGRGLGAINFLYKDGDDRSRRPSYEDWALDFNHIGQILGSQRHRARLQALTQRYPRGRSGILMVPLQKNIFQELGSTIIHLAFQIAILGLVLSRLNPYIVVASYHMWFNWPISSSKPVVSNPSNIRPRTIDERFSQMEQFLERQSEEASPYSTRQDKIAAAIGRKIHHRINQALKYLMKKLS